jgi:hypothetical protein
MGKKMIKLIELNSIWVGFGLIVLSPGKSG